MKKKKKKKKKKRMKRIKKNKIYNFKLNNYKNLKFI